MEANEATGGGVWLPLGSALIIDWKQLGRGPSARGATAWCASLDGETVLLRAWGEDMTSSFEFLFTGDERLTGTIVVQVERQDAGVVRVTTSIEVDNHLSLAETTDFKEHPRTMVLGRPLRTVNVKQGSISPQMLPPLIPAAAEVFEISPDSALLTHVGGWIGSILRAVRNHVRMATSPEPRGKTERGAPLRPTGGGRETFEGPRKIVATAGKPATNGAGGNGSPGRAPDRPPEKLLCTTNTGETFDITQEETYVGRSKQCAIVLKSQRVSRKHACITREADGFYINDLGAANGIWSGSEKIDRERIKSGDQYIVGDIVLSFSYT
jgi:FHA domain-containing protein